MRGLKFQLEGPVASSRKISPRGRSPSPAFRMVTVRVSTAGGATTNQAASSTAITMPGGEDLDVADFSDPTLLETYEGVLVRLTNAGGALTVTAAALGYGEWEVDSAVRIDDLLFEDEDGFVSGGTFDSITVTPVDRFVPAPLP